MFILLRERDTDRVHRVNIIQIDDYTDLEVYVRGRRFKVNQTAREIDELIHECLGSSDPDYLDLFWRTN